MRVIFLQNDMLFFQILMDHIDLFLRQFHSWEALNDLLHGNMVEVPGSLFSNLRQSLPEHFFFLIHLLYSLQQKLHQNLIAHIDASLCQTEASALFLQKPLHLQLLHSSSIDCAKILMKLLFKFLR